MLWEAPKQGKPSCWRPCQGCVRNAVNTDYLCRTCRLLFNSVCGDSVPLHEKNMELLQDGTATTQTSDTFCCLLLLPPQGPGLLVPSQWCAPVCLSTHVHTKWGPVTQKSHNQTLLSHCLSLFLSILFLDLPWFNLSAIMRSRFWVALEKY